MKLLALVLFAVLQAIPLGSNGSFSALDAALIVLLPVLVPVVFQSRELKLLWATGLCWSISQIVIDLAKGRAFPNEVELAGVTIPLLVTGMVWLKREYGFSAGPVLLASGAGWLGSEVLAAQVLTSANPWKYGLSYPLIVISLAAILTARRSWVTTVFVLAAFVGLSVAFDSRSQAGMLLLTLVVVLLRVRLDARGRRSKGLVVFVAVVAVLGYLSYPSLALNGFFGDRAMSQQQEYESENADFILATRLELPQMAYLASSTMPFGIGAYGEISGEQSDNSLAFLDSTVVQLSHNQRMYLTYRTDGFVGYNSHSAFMASLLYGGLAAAPFWVLLFLRALGGLRSVLIQGSSRTSVIVYLCLLVLWDSLFSPMTAQSPIEYSLMLFAVLRCSRGDVLVDRSRATARQDDSKMGAGLGGTR